MAIDIRRTEMTRAFASSERLQLVFIHIGSVCLSACLSVCLLGCHDPDFVLTFLRHVGVGGSAVSLICLLLRFARRCVQSISR